MIAVVASGFAYVGLTDVAIDKRVISNYFGNIAFAYEDYGFPYCFAASLFNTGINQPAGYSEETMAEINKDGCLNVSETSRSKEELPNIMFVQLESYFDPTEVEWLRFSEDPIPNLRKLYADYSSGYFKVPSVGAGGGRGHSQYRVRGAYRNEYAFLRTGRVSIQDLCEDDTS